MDSGSKKKLYVTHCVDVEGPMTETLDATWERILCEDGIAIHQEPTIENLKKLQNQSLDIEVSDEIKSYLAHKFCKRNLSYLNSWEEIDAAISNINTEEFRFRYKDALGQPYRLNWFIYDHYGFTNNPRFHAEGIHAIWDHYHRLFLDKNEWDDGIFWHYHHVPVSGDALEWNTNWFANGIHEEILARRVIEREWFPSVFRAGGHIERNDLSFWLEMFIPFDYSGNTPRWLVKSKGRASVNDWRHSSTTWGCYHPDWYDYRRPGNMKRAVFRCLDLKTWITALKKNDVRDAFEQADAGYDTVLAYYNHDYRDMAEEIDYGYGLIKEIEKDFPDVKWQYASCKEAARAVCGYNDQTDQAPKIDYKIEGCSLTVFSDRSLFGPEPFLAIKENGKFFRDNFTRESSKEWCYQFRCPDNVETFGIAGNSPGGETCVVVHRGGLNG